MKGWITQKMKEATHGELSAGEGRNKSPVPEQQRHSPYSTPVSVLDDGNYENLVLHAV